MSRLSGIGGFVNGSDIANVLVILTVFQYIFIFSGLKPEPLEIRAKQQKRKRNTGRTGNPWLDGE